MTSPQPDDTPAGVAPRACGRCGEPIGADRLAALRRTTTCLACASLRKPASRGRTCS